MLHSCIIVATTEITITSTSTTAMSNKSISIIPNNETTILDSTETYNGEHIYKTLHLLPMCH